LGLVVCGGFEPLDIVGADEDAIDEFPWVADVPVALWWVELHPANVAPHIANASAGTARRHHTAMSSTPPRRDANGAGINKNCNLPMAEAASERDHVYNTYLPDLVRV